MNVKNFLIGTVAASVVYFLLGWLFYGILFKDIWPLAEGATSNVGINALGCLFSGATLSFIFSKFGAASSSFKSAAINGGVIGALSTLALHLYMMASGACNSMTVALTDTGVNFVMYAVAGVAIWFATSKFGGSSE